MKYLLLLILLFNIALSNEQFFDTEQSIFESEHLQQEEPQSNLEDALPLNEEEGSEEEPQINTFIEETIETTNWFEAVPYEMQQDHENNIYAKFLNYPEKIHTYQRFAVEIEALITTSNYTHLETRFLGAKNIALINPQSPWEAQGKANTFHNLFFFKVYSADFSMPRFQIILYNNDEIVDVLYLDAKPIEYTSIALGDELFTDVIAEDLKVISSKTKQYSNDELLTVLELESTNGNLEDFRLKYVDEQLLMSLEESYPKQKLIYNAIIPIYTKVLNFKYYDITTKTFKTLSVPIKLEEELVSTQTDLNPNNSSVELYKKTAAGIATILFLLLYIFKRKRVFIFLGLACLLVFYIFAKPNNSIVIEEGTKIYILPTKNSTVFHITQRKQLVEILTQKGPFSKILFETQNNNKTIGWIKEKNIVED